jgi:hypothetical protein
MKKSRAWKKNSKSQRQHQVNLAAPHTSNMAAIKREPDMETSMPTDRSGRPNVTVPSELNDIERLIYTTVAEYADVSSYVQCKRHEIQCLTICNRAYP